MNRRILFCIAILAAILAAGVCASLYLRDDGDSTEISPRNASELASGDEEKDLPSSVDELLYNLKLDGFGGLLAALDGDQLALFGFSDITERLSAVAKGEHTDSFGNVLSYIFALFGADVAEFLPMCLAVIAITIAYSLMNNIKSRRASDAIERVVYFATATLAIGLVVGYFASVLVDAVGYIATLKSQINTVTPVILTLMTAAGATSSAGAYTPSIAILGSGMTNLVTYIVFPAMLMSLVFDIIGSISSTVKLDKAAEFFRSACKWFLGTAFFIFVTVIGLSGITASVRDGISVRAARFAVSKYVPVIGGYLSQGFDFIMAGNVLIKNALGSSAVILIVIAAAPIISKAAMFTLVLKLTAAACEPLGGDKFSNIMTSISKSSTLISTVVIAMTFLYVMFLSMLVCTGNIGL